MTLRPFRPLAGVLAVLLCGAATARAQLQSIVYVSGLSSPVGFIQDPSDQSVQYVVEQAGRIKVVHNDVVQATPVLDISAPTIIASGGERGLLGLAFPPNYGASGRFYVLYTRAGDGYIVVARYKRSAELAAGLGGISSFGVDSHSELYLVDHTRGLILKFSRGGPTPPTNVRIVRQSV